MTKFTEEMSPSDDEYRSFLEELETNPPSTFDTEALNAQIDARFQAVLDNLHYEPLREGNERAQEEMNVLTRYIEASGGVEPEFVETIAKNNLRIMAIEEESLVKMIKVAYSASEFDIASGTADPGYIFERKAKLYTDLLIKHGLESDNVLIEVMNKAVPGREITDPNDPELFSHFTASILEQAKEKEYKFEDEAELANICSLLGLDLLEDHDEYEKIKMAVAGMLHIAKNPFGSDISIAKRERQLHTAANVYELSPGLTERIVQLINAKFPL